MYAHVFFYFIICFVINLCFKFFVISNAVNIYISITCTIDNFVYLKFHILFLHISMNKDQWHLKKEGKYGLVGYLWVFKNLMEIITKMSKHNHIVVWHIYIYIYIFFIFITNITNAFDVFIVNL